MALVLAALSAVIYGTADFAGGMASRRNDGVAVTLSTQVIGLGAVLVAVAVWPGVVVVTGADLGWGALGGVGGGLGLMCFYPALGRGPMSVVAPTTAVCSALLPALIGVSIDGWPSAWTTAGVAVALPAIGLAAREASGEHRVVEPLTVLLSIGAGIGFGVFFAALSAASDRSGMWPLLAARVASVSLVILVWSRRGRPTMRPVSGTGWYVAAAGGFDVVANGFFVLAVRGGSLTWVAVIGSMYPVSTVLLARLVLRERLGALQRLGLGLAAAALVLVAAGR